MSEEVFDIESLPKPTVTDGDDDELAIPQDFDEVQVRRRFIPGEGETIDIDDYEMRGVTLLEGARACISVFGELVAWGWKNLAPNIIEQDTGDPLGQSGWVKFCADMWGCTMSTIWKAWQVAETRHALAPPEDVSPTLLYEIASGCENDAETEQVLNKALAEGWGAQDVRWIKALRNAGLLQDWELPRLIRKGRYLFIEVHGTRTPVAEFCALVGDARLGAKFLEMKSRWDNE
jgi:hypothetical protein